MAGYGQPYYGGFYNPYSSAGAMPDALNQFKAPYAGIPMQPPQMPSQMPQTAPVQSGNDLIFVLNEMEATAYPVAPNNTVTLWDKNEPTIYIKSVNAQGVPSMRILDFKERNGAAENHECKCGDKYVSKSAFAELQEKFNQLQSQVQGFLKKEDE